MLNNEITTILNDETLSKSKKMIALYELNLEIKEIANLLNVRYNFAYNVISNYTNVNGLTLRTKKREDSKKQLIVDLFKQGKSNREISQITQTNYNYVYKITSEYKKSVNE